MDYLKLLTVFGSIINKAMELWERRQLKKQIQNEIYLEELKKNEGAKKQARKAKKDRMSNISTMSTEQLRKLWEDKSKPS